MAINYSAGDYFRNRIDQKELQNQEQITRGQAHDYSKGWFKRGIGKGILGALPGIVTLNPIMAGAGAAGGFGGEALNHYAFKDQHPEIAGSAASLAALGSASALGGFASKIPGASGIASAASKMGPETPSTMTAGGDFQGLGKDAIALPKASMGAGSASGATPDWMNVGKGASTLSTSPTADLGASNALDASGLSPEERYKRLQAMMMNPGMA